MQQVPRRKFHDKLSLTKEHINIQQVSQRKIPRYITFYEQNQHATSSTNKTSITRRKTNVHISGREKSTCNEFQLKEIKI